MLNHPPDIPNAVTRLLIRFASYRKVAEIYHMQCLNDSLPRCAKTALKMEELRMEHLADAFLYEATDSKEIKKNG